MLTTVVLPLLVAVNVQSPSLAEIQNAKAVTDLFKMAQGEQRLELIAGGGRRAPGPDHGDDPNDETHQDIPAYNQRNAHKPSSDPYNGSTDNNKWEPNKPY